MKIKHSKFRNTGILFELLVRQVTIDTLKGVDSPAIDIMKKYFVKSEIGREYKLYESILKSKVLNEGRANTVISTVLESSANLNKSSLKRQKYNLIKEIKAHYDLDTFFGIKIKNYKELASIYTLIEGFNSTTFVAHKDLRILTYRVLLEKFNEKYDSISPEQKQILKEFINSVDSTPELRNFYNTKIVELKEHLSKSIKTIKDPATKIKVEEITKHLVELDKTSKVNDDNLVDLMQYYELVQEIKKANGVQI